MDRRNTVVAGLFILAVSALVITLASFADSFLTAFGYVVGGALGLVGVSALFVNPSKTRKR